MIFCKLHSSASDYRLSKLPVIIMFILFFFTPVSSASELTHTVKQHVITISGFEFSPKLIKVSKGDMITWRNQDWVPHNIAKMSDGSLLSVDFLKGESFSLQVDSGLSYMCGLHPSMRGKIVLN